MVGKILVGLLVAFAAGLMVFHGLSGSLATGLDRIFPGFVPALQATTERVASPAHYSGVVRPLVEAPAWIFPLILAAILQLLIRRQARDVG